LDPSETAGEAQRLRVERDLYLRLVELDPAEAPEGVLEEVLDLLVVLSGAERGFVQWRLGAGSPRFTVRALAVEAVESLAGRVSQGIVGEALANGDVVHTSSAALDPRFQAFESVRQARIEAVVCAPMLGGLGVVYLQGPRPFSADIVAAVGRAARSLAAVVARFTPTRVEDPTAPWRERLRAEGLIGQSPALAEMLRAVAFVAPVPMSVLLTGPTGAGKSKIARVIHDSGARPGGPFVAVNCSALPVALAESELFGAEAGAHSTALRRIRGKVAAAQGGTLFLDEIGELPMEVQPKLLELLESGRYFPLGSANAERSDARILTATHRDLSAWVAAGRFREDLFHRVSGFQVAVPGLDARRSDIPLLADVLLARACGDLGLAALTLDPVMRLTLTARSWPGHVRELDNAVRRAAVFAAGEGCSRVQPRHFETPGTQDGAQPATYGEATHAFQRQLLVEALAAENGNVSAVSTRLGLARSHLYTLLNAHGLR